MKYQHKKSYIKPHANGCNIVGQKNSQHWMWAAEIQIFKWRYGSYIVGCYWTENILKKEECAYPARKFPLAFHLTDFTEDCRETGAEAFYNAVVGYTKVTLRETGKGFDRSSIMTTYPYSESKSFNNHPEQDIATRRRYGEKAKGSWIDGCIWITEVKGSWIPYNSDLVQAFFSQL